MRKIYQKIKFSHGMTLVEVMIASGLMSIIALSIATYIIYLAKFETRANSSKTASDLLFTMYNNVQNDRAWAFTVADTLNTNLACLNNETDCRGLGSVEGAAPIFLKDTNNNLYYDPSELAGAVVGTPGFDGKGMRCDTYSATPTNDRCPFFVNLYWQAYCDGSTARCVYPLIKVTGTMAYSVASNDKAKPFSAGYNRLITYRNPIKAAKYETIVFDDRVASNTKGGTCTPGSWQVRNFTASSEQDSGSNVTLIGGNTLQFVAGTYDCEVSALGYGIGMHQIRLQDTTGAATLLTGTSEAAGTTYTGTSLSFAYGTFSITATSDIQVQHRCQQLYTGDNNSSFGKPATKGVDEVYTQLRCVRLE